MNEEIDKLYWSSIEYHYDKTNPEAKNLRGGFVYVFLLAFDVQDALKKIINELKSLKLKPVEIEFISPYDLDTEWDTDQQKTTVLSICKEVQETSDVIFDTFHAYEKV
jgi:uncharacterized membrane protein